MNLELINRFGNQAQQSVRRQQLVDLDFLEKFAELMYDECIDAVPADLDPAIYFKVLMAIKEHFGVK